MRRPRLFLVERRPLTEAERRRFVGWWLNRYSDAELADLALGLGVEGASAEREVGREGVVKDGADDQSVALH